MKSSLGDDIVFWALLILASIWGASTTPRLAIPWLVLCFVRVVILLIDAFAPKKAEPPKDPKDKEEQP